MRRTDCGMMWFGSKVWHSNDKYRRVVYQCNNKFAGAKKCTTPHLTETEIKKAFVKVVNKLLEGKNGYAGKHPVGTRADMRHSRPRG